MINHEKGFTLIEVLAASAILGMVVLSFVFLTSYTAKTAVDGGRSSEALLIAKREMAEFQSLHAQKPISLSQQVIINKDDENNPIYQITLQQTEFPSENYDLTTIQKNSVSLQSILLAERDGLPPAPHLFTVTVSWDGDSQ